MFLDKQKAMRELGIPEEIYNELIGVLLIQSEEAMNELELAVASADLERFARAAYFIKGAAGNRKTIY